MMERTGRAPLCLSNSPEYRVKIRPQKVGDGQKDNNEQQGSGSSAPAKEKTALLRRHRKVVAGRVNIAPSLE